MSDNSIGDFNFLELLGTPDVPKQTVTIIQRDGVNGTSLWLAGGKGKPFTMRSKVDAGSLADAQNLFVAYCTLIGAGAFDMTFRGNAIEGCAYSVLDVRSIDIAQLAGGLMGGLNSPSFGWCECEWTLLAVQTE